ncbi:hypothetical protein ACZ90_21350 [Streptomyces albus subsp. albus]|nr:hypothetical protein ACZ90_21350 [Streptomyces albus subsp. albus]
MTNERILAICRSNWEYRGIADPAVREMLEELAAHLADAEAAGRTARDVVGDNVPAFAASWARAHAPLPRRALRTASLTCFVLGWLVLIAFLFHWTTELALHPDDIAFGLVLALITTVWEMRGGNLGMARHLVAALSALLVAMLLSWWLGGDGTPLTLPLWVVPVLLLPGLPYAVADARSRKRAAAEAARVCGEPG